jgi:hypothetical protein
MKFNLKNKYKDTRMNNKMKIEMLIIKNRMIFKWREISTGKCIQKKKMKMEIVSKMVNL